MGLIILIFEVIHEVTWVDVVNGDPGVGFFPCIRDTVFLILKFALEGFELAIRCDFDQVDFLLIVGAPEVLANAGPSVGI
jgi:hypothetical protein